MAAAPTTATSTADGPTSPAALAEIVAKAKHDVANYKTNPLKLRLAPQVAPDVQKSHITSWKQGMDAASNDLDAGSLATALAAVQLALTHVTAGFGEQHMLTGSTYVVLGTICRRQRKFDYAFALYEKAALIFQGEPNQPNNVRNKSLATAVHGAAASAMDLNNYLEAQARAVSALQMFRELDDPLSVANVLEMLTSIALRKGDVSTADAFSAEAMELYLEYGAVGSVIELALGVRAPVFLQQDKYREVFGIYAAVTAIMRAEPKREGLIAFVDNLTAALHRDLGRPTLAEPLERTLAGRLAANPATVPPYTSSRYLQTHYTLFDYTLPGVHGVSADARRSAVGRVGLGLRHHSVTKRLAAHGPATHLYITATLQRTDPAPVVFQQTIDVAAALKAGTVEVVTPPSEAALAVGSQLLEIEIYADEARTNKIGTHRQYVLAPFALAEVTAEQAATGRRFIETSSLAGEAPALVSV